jgi:hypothetical protein
VLGDYGKPFYANPYLNALVFGIYLDSALNDIGMLLAFGFLRAGKPYQGAIKLVPGLSDLEKRTGEGASYSTRRPTQLKLSTRRPT